jgi:methylated-DNA-protein-cysteine methyltransferase-like protein
MSRIPELSEPRGLLPPPLTAAGGLRHNDGMALRDRAYARIYHVVRQIPQGRVATYGQVAALAGMPGQARQVGYALHALPDDEAVPWHRVINAQGQVSTRAEPFEESIQRQLLEREGLRFDASGRTDLVRYRWNPRSVRGALPGGSGP